MNTARGAGEPKRRAVTPGTTKATQGHASGAAALLRPAVTGSDWKMARFTSKPARVTQYMGKAQRAPTTTAALGVDAAGAEPRDDAPGGGDQE